MSWKANEKPRRRVRSSRLRTVALVALVARGNRPRGSAHAAMYTQVPCQSSKKHQSGNSSTNREKSTKRWSDSLQVRPGGGAIRPSGWSDSPQGVERIAPLGTPYGQPSAARSASSARSGGHTAIVRYSVAPSDSSSITTALGSGANETSPRVCTVFVLAWLFPTRANTEKTGSCANGFAILRTTLYDDVLLGFPLENRWFFVRRKSRS